MRPIGITWQPEPKAALSGEILAALMIYALNMGRDATHLYCRAEMAAAIAQARATTLTVVVDDTVTAGSFVVAAAPDTEVAA